MELSQRQHSHSRAAHAASRFHGRRHRRVRCRVRFDPTQKIRLRPMDRQRPAGNRRITARAEVSRIHGKQTRTRARGQPQFDRWCVVAVYNEDEWQRFARLVEQSGLKRSENFATHLERVRHKEELDKWVTRWSLQYDPYEVMEKLQGIGICAAVVQDVEDQFKRDRQYAATGYLVRMNEPEAGEVVTENVPVRLSETPGKVRCVAPLMGKHTHEIARNLLGLSDDEIKKLDEEKALY